MKINVKEFKATTQSALSNSPIETLLSLIFFITSCYTAIALEGKYDTVWHNILWYFIVCTAIAYALNIIFKTGTKRMLYYISILTPVAFYYYIKDDFSFTTLAITSICSLLIIYVARNLKDNNKFTYNAISVTTNIITAGALTVISVLATYSITSSITYIFDIAISDVTNQIVVYCGIFLLFPLLFLIFEYKENYEIKTNRFLETLLNYILTPAIIIYGVILYVYFAKIVALWTLPKGVVATTAMCFIAGGILIKACRIIPNKKFANWFFNYFGYISLPALAMLWISIIYRISQYGLTGDRVYLGVSVTVLTIWIFASMCSKTDKYQYLTIFTIIIYVIFTYVPYINAQDVEKRATLTKGTENDTPEIIYLCSDNRPDVNISGFNNLYRISKNYDTNDGDTLTIKKNDNIIFKKSYNEVLINIFKEVGIENYNTLSKDSILNLKDKLNIYRDSNTIVIFNTLSMSKLKDTLTLKSVAINCLITTDK